MARESLASKAGAGGGSSRSACSPTTAPARRRWTTARPSSSPWPWCSRPSAPTPPSTRPLRALFAAYPTPAGPGPGRLPRRSGRSSSAPSASSGSKAKNLVALAQTVAADFGGEVPADVDLLQKLPGVGRKTANCVMCEAFKDPPGHRRGHPRLPHRPPAEAGRPLGRHAAEGGGHPARRCTRASSGAVHQPPVGALRPRVLPRPQPPLRRLHRRRSVPHPRALGIGPFPLP